MPLVWQSSSWAFHWTMACTDPRQCSHKSSSQRRWVSKISSIWRWLRRRQGSANCCAGSWLGWAGCSHFWKGAGGYLHGKRYLCLSYSFSRGSSIWTIFFACYDSTFLLIGASSCRLLLLNFVWCFASSFVANSAWNSGGECRVWKPRCLEWLASRKIVESKILQAP